MVENQTDHASVKIEPLILLLIHIFALFFLFWLAPLPFVFPGFLEWLGYALIVIAIVLARSAIFQLRQAQTTAHPYRPVTDIVTSGPYRFSRNPIYLGFLCLLIGSSFALRSYLGLSLGLLFVVLMNTLVIQYEDGYLEKKFKDAYTSYKSRVRRWL
ncbi:MAG: isoprenylcysteine carboxylmethyltransferase family protein [Chloroflexi bacterium]|nr:MAG: isoprenylcysteine carboxylmethyltransferase family protein [Chloroflexota bacterium]